LVASVAVEFYFAEIIIQLKTLGECYIEVKLNAIAQYVYRIPLYNICTSLIHYKVLGFSVIVYHGQDLHYPHSKYSSNPSNLSTSEFVQIIMPYRQPQQPYS